MTRLQRVRTPGSGPGAAHWRRCRVHAYRAEHGPDNVTRAYPPAVGRFPNVDGNQRTREFSQRQAHWRKEVQVKPKRIRAAQDAGKPVDPKGLGPVY